jgi:hypothetical protein
VSTPTPGRGSTASGSGIGDLFNQAARLFRAHLWTFVAISGGVVAFVDLVLGVGLGELTSGYRSRTASGVDVITLAASAFVTTPLITGMLAQAVVDVRAGGVPTAGRAVQRGLDLFAPILFVILLYLAAVVAGFFAFVAPGVFFGVSWYFVAQAVVVDDCRGFRALARSGELVRGNWWRALATGLVFNVAVAIPSSVVNIVFELAAKAADSEGIVVLGDIVYQAFALPFVAIGATLFYLRLRDEPRPARVAR